MTPFEELMWLFNSIIKTRHIVRMNIAEGALLYKYSRRKKDSTILEIGRKQGGSAIIMAAAIEKGRVYSIDKIRNPHAIRNCRNFSDKIVLVDGDSAKIKWRQPIGLLFIDGDHSYNGLRSDIRRYCPWVEQGGYVLFHDVLVENKELRPLYQKLLHTGYSWENSADSLLVIRKKKEGKTSEI